MKSNTMIFLNLTDENHITVNFLFFYRAGFANFQLGFLLFSGAFVGLYSEGIREVEKNKIF